ncbi:hypothetical protein [Exiguobacterium sp. s80]|uniref:hypothetical protein n=1 Tax=Exiguobacterium sp. s80 TaxID=2751209 RepID=UPI001BEB761C|nr:hypothetical protein [Exiguobacterium sp. s80]
METTIEINIQDNLLNIFTNTTLDDILKSMIKLDADSFTNYHNEELQKNKRGYNSGDKKIEAILSIIDRKNASAGTRADGYVKKLKNEFFNRGQKYAELFHEQYLTNLEYHFNVRRVYGMGYSIENYDCLEDYLNSLYLLLIKNYDPKITGEYIPAKVTDIKLRNDNYFSIYKDNKKIELYEKIGVIYQTEKKNTKSVFVKYTFDFENDFFELSYNENTLKDLCNPSIDMKKIILESADINQTITSKFANEKVATLTLYSRMKGLVESKLAIRSIGDQIARIALDEEMNKEKDEVTKLNNLKSFNTENEAFNKSPFELAMYKLFKEDRDSMISRILGENEEKDTSDIEDFINEKFKDFDNHSVGMSVKFLKNMKAFTKLKKKSHIINGLEDFIFSFTVRDWEVTKSTTKNQERLPVYTSDFYWHLQEVVDGIKLINELGLHVSTVIPSGEKFSQEIKITLSNDHLIFIYYQNDKRISGRVKSIKNTLKISEARAQINDNVKNKFRKIISEKSESQ